jgi:hypothetical protein
LPLSRRVRVALLAACALVPTLVAAGPSSAATVPLNNRSFNDACNAANAGDTITVPAGSYSSQTINCQKAVTFQGQSKPTVAYIAFNSANGPKVDGFTITGGAEAKASQNVGISNSNIYNLTYIEASSNVLLDHNVHTNAPGGTTWSNGDMVDIYPNGNTPNKNITIQDSVLHGLRAPSSAAHSDAVQLYNNGAPHTGIKLLRNKFYDNECVNLRANPGDELTLENNSFGDSYKGISGCGFYAIDVGYANVTARYNVFPGSQEVQETPTSSGIRQTWVGNAGAGFSAGCGSGGAAGGSYSRNVWTEQKCGSTDKQVSSLSVNSDGTPKSGSPLVDAGDTGNYPLNDLTGAARYAGSAPDAGAFESGATGGGGTAPADPSTPSNPAPPADTTAPDTTITSKPSNGTSTSASFAFTASESGSTFECKLDGGSWVACTSPKAYSSLATGSHTFSVRAKDAAGNTDASPATATWTISSSSSTTPSSPSTPAGGLVAAYGFNETSGTTAKDSSGNGLNGYRSGATPTTAGKFGGALSFDGDHDTVTVADNDKLDLTKGMTLEAWVAPSTTSGWRTILAKEQSRGLTYGLYGSSDNGGKPSADVFTSSEVPTYGTGSLPLNTWSHVAATFDGSKVTFYVNGTAVASKSVSGSMVTSSGVLRIGGTSIWGEWFKGKIDEVRVYNTPLSATEIKADMTKAI